MRFKYKSRGLFFSKNKTQRFLAARKNKKEQKKQKDENSEPAEVCLNTSLKWIKEHKTISRTKVTENISELCMPRLCPFTVAIFVLSKEQAEGLVAGFPDAVAACQFLRS